MTHLLLSTLLLTLGGLVFPQPAAGQNAPGEAEQLRKQLADASAAVRGKALDVLAARPKLAEDLVEEVFALRKEADALVRQKALALVKATLPALAKRIHPKMMTHDAESLARIFAEF